MIPGGARRRLVGQSASADQRWLNEQRPTKSLHQAAAGEPAGSSFICSSHQMSNPDSASQSAAGDAKSSAIVVSSISGVARSAVAAGVPARDTAQGNGNSAAKNIQRQRFERPTDHHVWLLLLMERHGERLEVEQLNASTSLVTAPLAKPPRSPSWRFEMRPAASL
jgi:hypothetical protein